MMRRSRRESGDGHASGRLTARPGARRGEPLSAGEHRPGPDAGWAGVLYVPEAARTGRPVPMMLALHGATGSGERMLGRWRETAERAGLAVLAPDSLQRTWDVLHGGFGPDVERIDRALAEAFARVAVDPSHLLVEGFSDGASYALSLGLANGDLFGYVLANSPGFCWPPSINGRPRFLLTHGTEDQVLPIDRTSRMLAPQLDLAGYELTYHEFEGGHALTPEIMALSLRWAGVRPAAPSPDAENR